MKLLILLSCLSTAGLMAQLEPQFRDVSYGPHERHKLDLWQAKATAPAPLLIFIHGGGWNGGGKEDIPLPLLRTMLARGVSVASINYRYTKIAVLPAPVYDAARAVRFLRSKAAGWHLDSHHFGAYGISAGATTALWLACHDDLADPGSDDPVARQSTRLQAAVALSPQTSIEPGVVSAWVGDQILLHPMIFRAVGAKSPADLKPLKPEWAKLLREFSPIQHLTVGDPPIMLSNPRIDPLPATTPSMAVHHVALCLKFQERAQSVGVTCRLRIQDQPATTVPTPEDFLIEHLHP